jgi:hypothetical protein
MRPFPLRFSPQLLRSFANSLSSMQTSLLHCCMEHCCFHCYEEAFVFIAALTREYNNDAPFNCCVTGESWFVTIRMWNWPVVQRDERLLRERDCWLSRRLGWRWLPSGMLRRRFRGAKTHLVGLMMEAVALLKRRSFFTRLNGARSQKTVTLTFW